MAGKSNAAHENLALGSKKPVTSYDVARQAGVSQSAVSRYFKPGGSMSLRTRAKILSAIETLGYQPNAIARSLITSRSSLVAVIVANIGFNPEFTSVLSRAIAARGLDTLLFTLDDESDADRVIDRLWQYRVAGVVSAVALAPRHIATLSQRSTPLIFLNRTYANISVNSVCCDHAEGEGWLVDSLCAAGHRRFAIVSGPEASQVSHQRVSGAAERLAAAGCILTRTVVADFTHNGGRAAMRELAAVSPLPDAVICANDMLALGCIDEARYGLGLNVPGDISIVGFDGLAPGQWPSYDLATISQPTRLMVDAAIDMLSDRIGNPTLTTEKRVFSGSFSKGSSARLGNA
jgi:DNA-binding LacI/PurR family transcriptional regulator